MEPSKESHERALRISARLIAERDALTARITELEAGAVAWEKTCERINREADAERDAAVEQVKTLREALEKVASQKLADEMDKVDADCADFEGGYDALIEIARAALATELKP